MYSTEDSSRKNIAVIFGGRSSEHDVSCISAKTIIRNISSAEWNIILIGITKDGRWLRVGSIEDIEDGSWVNSETRAAISPDASEKCIIFMEPSGAFHTERVDIVWPVLHGRYGEDGTIQGLLELADIPYVGCGVLASAVSMDKIYTKIIVDRLGIRQARSLNIRSYSISDDAGLNDVADSVETQIGYPAFVKPSKAGSSFGVSKAHSRTELIAALKNAAAYDDEILIEEFISGREIECAVIGGWSEPTYAAGVGEIRAAAEFYDFDAKYNNPDSLTITNPELPDGVADKIKASAVKIFQGVNGYGLSRVDFFVTSDGEVIFNEINTMPGFTSISMYPMLWESAGVPIAELVKRLIENGLKRYSLG